MVRCGERRSLNRVIHSVFCKTYTAQHSTAQQQNKRPQLDSVSSLTIERYITLLCCAVLCCAVRCGAVRCGAVRCGAVRCGAVLCCALLGGNVLLLLCPAPSVLGFMASSKYFIFVSTGPVCTNVLWAHALLQSRHFQPQGE